MIRNSLSKAQVPASGGDDATGTLRVKSSTVSIYNLDIHNDYGPGSQALALSAFGTKFGAYSCRFYSYQVSS